MPVSTRVRPLLSSEREPKRGLGRRAQDGRLTPRHRAGLGPERPEEDVVLGGPLTGSDGDRERPHHDPLRLEALGERLVRSHEDEVRRCRRAVVRLRRAPP